MDFQLTSLNTVIGIVVMLSAWIYIGHRIKQSSTAILPPVKLLKQYFLYMGIFFFCVWLPHTTLVFAPENFSLAMALGYVVGHVFLYTALLHVALMVCSIVPRLTPHKRLVTGLWVAAIVILSGINVLTVVFGERPVYDYAHHITDLNTNPVVGAVIGLFALFSFVPAIVLFTINAVRSTGAHRARSIILAAGFVLLFIGGPLHDFATNWQMYVLADILTIMGVIVIGSGVIYRLEQTLVEAPKVRPAVASSNTV